MAIKIDYETGVVSPGNGAGDRVRALEHNEAWVSARSVIDATRRQDHQFPAEQAIASTCHALKAYADSHKLRFDSKIADDYVLGPAWLAMLKGVRTLLNGETGRLDCGTVDGFILALAVANGFKEEDL